MSVTRLEKTPMPSLGDKESGSDSEEIYFIISIALLTIVGFVWVIS